MKLAIARGDQGHKGQRTLPSFETVKKLCCIPYYFCYSEDFDLILEYCDSG